MGVVRRRLRSSWERVSVGEWAGVEGLLGLEAGRTVGGIESGAERRGGFCAGMVRDGARGEGGVADDSDALALEAASKDRKLGALLPSRVVILTVSMVLEGQLKDLRCTYLPFSSTSSPSITWTL